MPQELKLHETVIDSMTMKIKVKKEMTKIILFSAVQEKLKILLQVIVMIILKKIMLLFMQIFHFKSPLRE